MGWHPANLGSVLPGERVPRVPGNPFYLDGLPGGGLGGEQVRCLRGAGAGQEAQVCAQLPARAPGSRVNA